MLREGRLDIPYMDSMGVWKLLSWAGYIKSLVMSYYLLPQTIWHTKHWEWQRRGVNIEIVESFFEVYPGHPHRQKARTDSLSSETTKPYLFLAFWQACSLPGTYVIMIHGNCKPFFGIMLRISVTHDSSCEYYQILYCFTTFIWYYWYLPVIFRSNSWNSTSTQPLPVRRV